MQYAADRMDLEDNRSGGHEMTEAESDAIVNHIAKAVDRSRKAAEHRDWKWFDVLDNMYAHLNCMSKAQLLDYSNGHVDQALNSINLALQAFVRGCGRSSEEADIARLLSMIRTPLAQLSVRIRDVRRSAE